LDITEIGEENFERQLAGIREEKRIMIDSKIEKTVKKILADVRENGDRALLKYTRKYDGISMEPDEIEIKAEEFEAASKAVDEAFLEALHIACGRIEDYHQRQKNESWFYEDQYGSFLGSLVRPLGRVGLYIPGGRAAYPSSVLMTALPAKTAGVEEIVIVTPPDEKGEISPEVLCAAQAAGVKRIFKVGGAQAVAALCWGTETIPGVDKICGPGNIYVTSAKKQVFGDVGIDMLAGPSEIVVVADKEASPKIAAADLLSQAEHDPLASCMLLTVSKDLARKVKKELKSQLESLPKKKDAEESLNNNGKIFVFSDLYSALKAVNIIAPEHLELMVENPFSLLSQIKSAGAIFIGSNSGESFGDYISGPSHVLPTGGTARFQSPLGVSDFMTSSSLIGMSQKALDKLGADVEILAEKEGLDAHANSIRMRREKEV